MRVAARGSVECGREPGRPRSSEPGRPRCGERGSGSILAVALIAGMLCLVAMLLPLQLALARGQALAGAADAAALAAADVSSGAVAGYPCEAAGRVAGANGATLEACQLDGLVATVRVSGTVLGIRVQAAATAGPPPDT